MTVDVDVEARVAEAVAARREVIAELVRQAVDRGLVALVVLGLSARWREEGLGETRREVARRARPPVLLVRKGPRPSGVAPSETLTRFTWSLSSATRAS